VTSKRAIEWLRHVPFVETIERHSPWRFPRSLRMPWTLRCCARPASVFLSTSPASLPLHAKEVVGLARHSAGRFVSGSRLYAAEEARASSVRPENDRTTGRRRQSATTKRPDLAMTRHERVVVDGRGRGDANRPPGGLAQNGRAFPRDGHSRGAADEHRASRPNRRRGERSQVSCTRD